jgi:hypothetical protein
MKTKKKAFFINAKDESESKNLNIHFLSFSFKEPFSMKMKESF